MVLISERANNDLDDILEGLLHWSKHQLERAFVIQYVSELVEVCFQLDKLNYHANAHYQSHKHFGEKVYKFRRNKHTQWYVVYNIDISNNIIYVEKIISNYQTR